MDAVALVGFTSFGAAVWAFSKNQEERAVTFLAVALAGVAALALTQIPS